MIKKRRNQDKVRNLTVMALMLAITIILSIIPTLGMIPIGSLSATTMQIPTIITAIILGPVYGGLMGGLFGLVSLIKALLAPLTPLDPLFINPIISVLPRIFIGPSAYYIYAVFDKIFNKKKKVISSFLGGMAGAITNTILVMTLLYFVYARALIEKMGLASMAEVRITVLSIITTNGIVEAILSGIIVAGVVVAYDKAF